MHAHEPCAPPVVPSTRAGPAAFGVLGGTSHKAPPARAFEGVGAVEAVRNDAPWFGRVLGRCQGDGTSGHNDGCGCRPIVWWSVVAGQTGGGCSRSSARRFPRLRVRDAFFTSAAVQRVGARVNFAAHASTLPHSSGGGNAGGRSMEGGMLAGPTPVGGRDRMLCMHIVGGMWCWVGELAGLRGCRRVSRADVGHVTAKCSRKQMGVAGRRRSV